MFCRQRILSLILQLEEFRQSAEKAEREKARLERDLQDTNKELRHLEKLLAGKSSPTSSRGVLRRAHVPFVVRLPVDLLFRKQKRSGAGETQARQTELCQYQDGRRTQIELRKGQQAGSAPTKVQGTECQLRALSGLCWVVSSFRPANWWCLRGVRHLNDLVSHRTVKTKPAGTGTRHRQWALLTQTRIPPAVIFLSFSDFRRKQRAIEGENPRNRN